MNDKIIQFEKQLKEEEKAENTINKYLHDIKEFYDWFRLVEANACGALVTKDALLDYKEHLKKSKLKVSSINSKISSINAYFAFSENESLKLKVLKCQKSLFGSKDKELTKNELNKLYNATRNDERLRLLIETISKTGIRVSEVRYITVDAIKRGKAEIDNKGKIRTILIPRKLCIKLLNHYSSRELQRGEIYKSSSCTSELHEPSNRTGEQCEPIFTTRNGTPLDRKQI